MQATKSRFESREDVPCTSPCTSQHGHRLHMSDPGHLQHIPPFAFASPCLFRSGAAASLASARGLPGLKPAMHACRQQQKTVWDWTKWAQCCRACSCREWQGEQWPQSSRSQCSSCSSVSHAAATLPGPHHNRRPRVLPIGQVIVWDPA